MFFRHAVIAIQLGHFLFADRNGIHLGAIGSHLACQALLLIVQPLGFAIDQLQAHRCSRVVFYFCHDRRIRRHAFQSAFHLFQL
jgi:hypothetical protein